MPRLKSRERFPPGGFAWYHPETRWSAPANVSFESVVQAIIAHRKANPHLMQQHGWSVDPESVRNQLDDSNARRCAMLGYTDYYYEGPGDPAPNPNTPLPTNLQKLGSVVGGSSTLVEWLASGAEAVSSELANKRAAICAECPQNGKGDFTRYFTVPVSEAIRHEINRRSEWKLQTPHDEKLSVCEACLCPLKLKVHVPLANILPHMDEATKARLDPRCWITKGDAI